MSSYDVVYVVSNAVIALGYGALGLLMLSIRSRWPLVFSAASAVSASAFLMSCGGTHVELLLHANTGVTLGETTHGVALHALQAVAVVSMLVFLLRDTLRWSDRELTSPAATVDVNRRSITPDEQPYR